MVGMQMAEDLDEFIDDFRVESHDALGQIEAQLLEMENGDEEAVNIVFRAMHSLKGGSSFLELININRLSHSLENILDLVRQGLLQPSRDMNDLLLRGSDLLLEMIDAPECGESHDVEAILEETRYFLDHGETVEQAGRITKEDNSALEARSQESVRDRSCDSEILARSIVLDDVARDEKKPFGQFLIDKSYVSADRVFAALIEQERRSTPDLQAFLDIGLEISDCMYVANVARRKMVHPLRVACELGMVNESVVEQVNDVVQSSRPPIGQILRELKCCDSVESRLWLQEYYDYCSGVESDSSLYRELQEHQEQRALCCQQQCLQDDTVGAEDAATNASQDYKQGEVEKYDQEYASSNHVLVNGSDIDCETSLIADYQEYTTEDLRTDIENTLLYFDSPNDDDIENVQGQLKVLFRVMHSLKGSAGFIGADASQHLVHELEESIILIQRAPSALTADVWQEWISVFLVGIDVVWELCACIGHERTECNYIREHKEEFNVFTEAMSRLKTSIAQAVQARTANEDIDDLF